MSETRKRKDAGFMRTVLAANMRALIDHQFPQEQKVTNKYKAFAKKAGVSLSTVQRFVNAEQGASIDYIEKFAYAFDLSPYHLLLPNLDVENPQIVQGAVAGEHAMYRKFNKAMRDSQKKPSKG